jgi:mannose-6-phosphate isomerase-like protein (cupin superfamily)
MVKQGTVLINDATGDKAEFIETSASTGGKQVKLKFVGVAGGVRPAAHVHMSQDETFEVISGYFTYVMDGKINKIGPGQSVTLPKGTPHQHYNGDSVDCEYYHIASPALDFEDIMVRIFELSNAGKIVNGNPPVLEAMVWIKKYEAKTYLAGMPVGLQNFMATMLAPVGRALGYGK